MKMIDTTLQSWLRSQLFEQVPCKIAIIDRDWKIVEHNHSFRELFGPGVGRPCYEIYKKRKEPCEQCTAALTFEDGKTRINEEVGLDRNGRTAHYLVHMVPIMKENGGIPYVVEMSTDITEIKRLQQEYQTLFDKVPCYIAVLNRDFRVVRANSFMQKTFGKTTSQYCWELFKHRDERCENCPADLAFADNDTHTSEQVGLNKEGKEIRYAVTAYPLTGGNFVNHVIEMAVDVTKIYRLEQEKIEAERLAAVGQTVAGLAHGIKNILTGLEGGVYIFKSGLDRGDRGRIDQGWDVLHRNIEKISVLAKNLLSFSKGITPKVKMVRPADIVHEVIKLYKETAGRYNIELMTECDESIAPAPMDPEGIHACLANLVSNAIDACQMTDKTSDKHGCEVRVRCREEDGCIIFDVEDKGCGMDYEVKQKVFTNFFTTKGEGGTGLGLLLTRKIVQEHGGRITMESVPGQGSLFRIIFPRKRLPQFSAEA
ncbi:MAG: PAS domain-containing protein [Deltaproteobacteria bacterium]|nr:PAS domain-containing protein [Deltaproteobacteria bacterium]MCL5276716.1 PAS domain-containing protein [Deltaproteobacteria bacterium]